MSRPPRPDHDLADCLRRLAEHQLAKEKMPLFPVPPPEPSPRPVDPWVLLRNLRAAQRRYFRTRDGDALAEAKNLEALVDWQIRDHFDRGRLPLGD